jgi:outer membrane protein assembly factor BamB
MRRSKRSDAGFRTAAVARAAVVATCFLGMASVAARQAGAPATANRPAPASQDWLLWGGPNRDFKSPGSGLSGSWPSTGPRKLWSRALGEGYSAVAVEGNRIYTAYNGGRSSIVGALLGRRMVITALDANTGQTVWEHVYNSSFRNAGAELGDGPYAMPQVVGERLVSVDGAALMYSLDKKTGAPAWSHDLYDEFGGSSMQFGYSSHALPYKGSLIAMVGGPRSALVSLKQSDGSVVWARHNFPNSHSSPLLINVDGQDQVVALMGQQVVAVEPTTGALLWQHLHPTQYDLAISTPVWGSDNVLVVSSSYEGGTRALHLTQAGGKTTVKQLWHNPRVRVHFGSIIRIDDTLYASSGHDGPAPITAVDVNTGNVLWQSGREFAKSQLLLADGKLIVLDQDGVLALATPSREGLKVLSKVQLLEGLAWTPPTLAGTRLYLRDRKSLMALDLAR